VRTSLGGVFVASPAGGARKRRRSSRLRSRSALPDGVALPLQCEKPV